MNINNFQIYKAELPARQDQLSKIKSQLTVSKKGGENWSAIRSGIPQPSGRPFSWAGPVSMSGSQIPEISFEENGENLENKFEKIKKLIQAEEEKNNDLAQQQTK